MAAEHPSEQRRLHCEETGTKNGKGSIVLLHGAFGSGARDFSMNIPYLKDDFHVILPDMPGHGKSQHIRPYSAPLAASLTADIIRERAENGHAHVIGFSMGMSVALELITKYPDLVDDVFMTGYKPLPYSNLLPYGWYASAKIEGLIPKSAMRWMMDGTEFSSGPPSTPLTVGLCREIAKPAKADETGRPVYPGPWPAKTLIMCAGKSDALPTADDAGAAVKLRDIARQLNPETVAYTHPRMRHPWLRQDPRLFAQTAISWFEKGKVPEGEGFVEL